MRAACGDPLQLGVAEKALLLGGERCRAVVARPHPVDVKHGHTRHRHERTFRQSRQAIAEQRLCRQSFAELKTWADGDVKETRLLTVLVPSLAIGVDGHGVSPRAIECQSLGEVIGAFHERRQLPVLVVAVGVEEGTFDESEEAWSKNSAGCEVLGGTVVAQVACVLVISHVEACSQAVCQPDVRIESQSQTAEVVTFQRALGIYIAQREVVVRHLVASLHADVVLMRQRLTIEIIVPLCFVVVLLIEIVVRIVLQELECRLPCPRASNQFRCIEAEAAGIHHRSARRCELHTRHAIHLDARSHAGAAPGIYDDNAIGPPDAVQRRTILQHRHTLDVCHIDVCQQVIVETIVQCFPSLLLIKINSVHNHQRHSVSMKGTEAVHQHHHAVALHATPCNGVHLCPQSCSNLVIDAHCAACSKIGCRPQMGDSDVLRIVSGKSLRPQPDWARCTDRLLHSVIPRCHHIQ